MGTTVKISRPKQDTVHRIQEIAIRALYRGNVDEDLFILGQRFAGVVLGITWSRWTDVRLAKEFKDLVKRVISAKLLRSDEISTLEKALAKAASETGNRTYAHFAEVTRQARKFMKSQR